MSKCDRCEYDFGDSSEQWTMHAEMADCVAHFREEIERLRLALNKSQTECGHMEADLQAARDDREACLTFLRTEMHWEEFREEFFANTASGENARKLMAFLNRFEKPKAGGE